MSVIYYDTDVEDLDYITSLESAVVDLIDNDSVYEDDADYGNLWVWTREGKSGDQVELNKLLASMVDGSNWKGVKF